MFWSREGMLHSELLAMTRMRQVIKMVTGRDERKWTR